MIPSECRVLHVSWEYPPLVYGGLGRHVEELTKAQAAAGATVTVLTQHGPGERRPDYEFVDGVHVLRVDPPTPEVPREPEALVEWTTKLDQRLGEVGSHLLEEFAHEWDTPPNVVHAHDWVVSQAARSLTRELGTRLVTTFHATESGRHQGWIEGDVSTHIDHVEASLSHHSDQIIVCSNWMKNEIRRQFRVSAKRVSVIPNGIDLGNWSIENLDPKALAKCAKTYGDGAPIVLFAGRLEWEKGVQTFIDAAATLKEQFSTPSTSAPMPHFVIAGTGTLEQQFKDQADEAGLGDVLTFEGWLPPEQIQALIASSSAVVIPSLYEPFGITALESAALGAPLVVARAGGLAEIVEDERCGRLFEPGNATELAVEIGEALNNPTSSRVMAQTLVGELPNTYDWGIIARDTMSVYPKS